MRVKGTQGRSSSSKSSWGSAQLSWPPPSVEGGQVSCGALYPSPRTGVLATWALLLASKMLGESGASLVDTFRLCDYGASTAGSGSCALARPRSSRYRVEAWPDEW
ncbi:hypothetical protein B296_00028222 [Ensete ventricosum]|uniref:Uncharacterized protein n=1 Tax=Ensete ventricosum TaxID=4639 RepID=A0A426ZPJ5_ENSVE|nr:hypothetical protein B296_00028222 [Ensete ventricosum]